MNISHEEAVDKVCAKEGFARHKMVKYLKQRWPDTFYDIYRSGKPDIGLLPDGWKITTNNSGWNTLHLLEVENTSRITHDKWLNILELWWYMDCSNWFLEVHIYDRFGTLSKIYKDKELQDEFVRHMYEK